MCISRTISTQILQLDNIYETIQLSNKNYESTQCLLKTSLIKLKKEKFWKKWKVKFCFLSLFINVLKELSFNIDIWKILPFICCLLYNRWIHQRCCQSKEIWHNFWWQHRHIVPVSKVGWPMVAKHWTALCEKILQLLWYWHAYLKRIRNHFYIIFPHEKLGSSPIYVKLF